MTEFNCFLGQEITLFPLLGLSQRHTTEWYSKGHIEELWERRDSVPEVQLRKVIEDCKDPLVTEDCKDPYKAIRNR